MEEEKFVFRTYGFGELAQLYCPNIQPNNASRQLRRWIDYNSELRESLETLGWKPRRKYLVSIQVRCILTYLGEP